MRTQPGATWGMALQASRFRRPYRIRNPRRLASWLTWASRLVILMLAAVAGLSLYVLLTIHDIMQGHHGSLVAMKTAEQDLLTASSVSVIVILGLGGFFLAWVYRISANAHAMGAQQLHFRPGASIALFFLPVLNLVLPPVMMDELWRVSLSIADWRGQKHTWVVPLWWVLHLAAAIGGILLILTGRGESVEDKQRILIWQVAYIAATLPLYIVLPALVNRITDNLRRQQRIAARSKEPLE